MIRSTEERSEKGRPTGNETTSEGRDVAEADRGGAVGGELPRPHLKRAWWPFPLVWILPILAAGMATYYGFTHLQQRGPQIVINFTDGSGLKVNETMITHLGVQIGVVTGMDLSPDKKTVRVNATLDRSQTAFAKDGAVYWTVRPEISVENISGLNTVLSGPYIEAMPGTGGDKSDFDGLQKAPTDYGPVVSFVLHAPRLEHLSPDAPVYFRGLEVGLIRGINLSSDASGIDVHIFVRHRYSNLVQTDSKFWLVKGADIKGGILSGLKVELGSLQEIVSGGVEFATPENGEGAIAKDGTSFALYDDYKKEWMDWSPRIPVLPDDTKSPDKSVGLPQTPEAARSLVN